MARRVNRLSEEEWDEINRNLVPPYTDHELAQIALDYVNDKQDVKFELDAPLGSGKQLRILPNQEWCHVMFYAKKPGSSDSCQKIIFVELCNTMTAKFDFSVYSIMDPQTPDIRDGCLFCPTDGKHPHPPEDMFSAGCRYGPSWDTPTDPSLLRDPEFSLMFRP